MADTTLSKQDWMKLLADPFEESMARVHETMTNHPAVQSWLKEDIFESTLNVEADSGVEEAAAAYGDIMANLEDRFPELLSAVKELTQGCGEVDLDWRPLSPQLTGLCVNFRRDLKIDVFVGLHEATPEAVSGALDRLIDQLPKSEPFPNRPNETTGIISSSGRCVAIRARDHNVDRNTRKQTFAVIKKHGDASGQHTRAEIEEHILKELTQPESDSPHG